jgi:hypothetical protein
MDLPIKYISSEDLENIAIKFDRTFESIKESLIQMIDNEGIDVKEVKNRDYKCLNNFIRRIFMEGRNIGIGRILAIYEPLYYSDNHIAQLEKKYDELFRMLTTEDYDLPVPLTYSIRSFKDLQRSQTIIEVNVQLSNRFIYNHI